MATVTDLCPYFAALHHMCGRTLNAAVVRGGDQSGAAVRLFDRSSPTSRVTTLHQMRLRNPLARIRIRSMPPQ